MKRYGFVIIFSCTVILVLSKCSKFNLTLNIIENFGFESEKHHVTTEDGYILELHRLPPTNNSKGPVFLQHGLLGSSADWLMTGVRSLPFLLNHLGFDVWLGNARGNTYSRNHTTLSVEDLKFWQFSWHEMGIYDLPAVFDYVYNVTQRKIVYIGHSMGTTMSFVFLSNSTLRNRYGRVIKKVMGLAPVAYMAHVKTPFKNLAYVINEIEFLEKLFGMRQFLPINPTVRKTLKTICKINVYKQMLCENFIFLLSGFDRSEFDPDLIPCIINYSPAGTSPNTVIHYGQEILNEGKFKMFDFGEKGNLMKYNSTTPPLYNLTSIRIPIRLFYSMNDWLSNYTDVERLSNDLGHVVKTYQITDPKFNHIDFIWGKHAEKLVFQNIFKELGVSNWFSEDSI